MSKRIADAFGKIAMRKSSRIRATLQYETRNLRGGICSYLGLGPRHLQKIKVFWIGDILT